MASSVHYFIPFMRQGLVALADHSVPSGKRVTIPVKVNLSAENKETNDILTASLNKEIALLGPGDVLGINRRIIVKTEPAQNSLNFEPNLIPFIEFADPDFLWRFSTRRTEDGKNWLPWLSLIILKVNEGAESGEYSKLKNDDPERPPRIKLSDDAILPDLKESWRWAHIHLEGLDNVSLARLKEKIKRSPDKAVCRLLSPRRLKPNTKYSAFLVPAYRIGVEAALGIESETERTALAWETPREAQGQIIPYYFHWDFRTGTRGDFEYLVTQLEPRKLTNLGTRPMDCSNPGYGMKTEQRELLLEGALRSLDTQYQEWGMDSLNYPNETQQKLKNLVRRSKTGADGKGTLQVAPPVYGSRYVLNADNPLDAANKSWLWELNLDFRHRAAAGLGSQFVKENQESLMQAAWSQLGEIRKVNRRLNLARFGRQLSLSMHKRMAKMNNQNFLRMALPLQNKIATAPRETLRASLSKAGVPGNLLHFKTKKYLAKKTAKIGKQKAFFAPIARERIVKRAFHPGGLSGIVLKSMKSVELDNNLFMDFGGKAKNELHPQNTITKKWIDRIQKFRDWEKERHSQAPSTPLSNPDSGKETTNEPDPLRPVMPYPEFHRPMYRFLMELSQEYILPGLETVPQNTVGLLSTNRRFIEAFMVGLNHEFAAELRWREFPTDMRGSYFRKFWESSIYSVDEQEKEQFRESEIGKKLFNSLKIKYKNKFDSWDKIEAAYTNGDPEIDEQEVAAAYEQAVENWLLSRESEKDISKLADWGMQGRLGDHANESSNADKAQEQIVLLIRGGLLQKFSNTLIYLVKKKSGTASPRPDMGKPAARIFPVFEGVLPPDMVFLGFPITKSQTIFFQLDNQSLKNLKSDGISNEVISKLKKMTKHKLADQEQFFKKLESTIGKTQAKENKELILKHARKSDYFIVFEERISDLRYGLDINITDNNLENLSWQHFSGISEGDYLNNTLPLIEKSNWNSAAFIARAFVQNQVRVAIELERLMRVTVE